MVCAFSITGNGMACNIGVRAAVYLYKNDPILFPEKTFGNWGAPLFYDSVVNNTCHTAPENILSGEVTWEGQANKMYDDLDNGRLSKFASIANAEECNYPDFGELQKQANNGGIIIGVKKNSAGHGHVVLIMPESFNERTDEETDFEIGGDEIKLPIVLECGIGDKEIRPIKDKYNIVNYLWYKYK
ncbi:MAG TPA: hypothetical protein DG754_05060 [Bacteroidales bacterium]|jgi:hypothetical protein|nr:hypothetical protein [Bacteroidales bacterium]